MFDIKEKIKSREATISIVGLGYVGSPLARAFSNVGFKVIGFDINEKRINEINEDPETKFEATSDPSKLDTDLIIVCVPTPVDNENTPDLNPIKSASSIIGKNMKEKTIVTTTLVGSHVCISEDDYCLLIRAANTGKAFEKEIKAKDTAMQELCDVLNEAADDLINLSGSLCHTQAEPKAEK